VFKVRHQEWQKELALKLPFRNVMEDKYFQTLKNEAETWVALGLHPHVVTCYYVRPLMGVPSIFMEYVSGGSLKELSEPVGNTVPRLHQGDELQRTLKFLDLIIQTAWGLEHAHSRGVLHLDIKPQNLLVEEDTGRLLVTDFGLARAAKDTIAPSDSASLWPGDLKSTPDPSSSPKTQTKAPSGFGTPQYMSPEASEKAPPSIGFDLWATTLTLLELFLGQRPWEFGATVGAALDQFTTLSRPFTPIPPQVMTFFRRALDVDPDKRHQKASEVSLALTSIYQQISGTEYPRPKPFTTVDSADNLNNRAVSLLDLGRPAEAEKLWRRALKQEPGHVFSFYNLALHRYHTKTMAPDVFQGQLDDLVHLSAGKRLVELPLMLSGGYLELGLIPEAEAALNAYQGPALSQEVRRLKETLERDRHNPHLIERSKPAIFRLSMISESSDNDAAARLLPQLLTKARQALETNNYTSALDKLKQARRLPLSKRTTELDALWRSLYGSLMRTELKDIFDESWLPSGLGGEVACFGGEVLVVGDDKNLRFLKNPQTSSPSITEIRLASPPTAMASSFDGSMVAVMTQDGHLWLFNPQTGAGAGQAMAHSKSGGAAAFRPDGRRLFTAGADGELKMWDTAYGYLDKGTPLLVKKLSEYPLKAMAFSPNGRILSVTDGLVEFRLPADKINGPMRTLPMANPGDGPRRIKSLVADPFNRFLLSAHETGLTFHPLFDTDWKADLGAVDSEVSACAISFDARLWALSLNDGRLLVGLGPDGHKNTFLPLRRLEIGNIHFLSFSQDNAFLFSVGKTGLGLHALDWELEVAQSRSWDKKSEMILTNFMARQADNQYSGKMLDSLAKEMADSGLIGLDPQKVSSRLRETVTKQSTEF
jgi:serine/threonine protein kinase